MKKAHFLQILQWMLLFTSIVIPGVPAKLIFSLSGSVINTNAMMLFLGLWIILGVANLFVGWYNSRRLNKRNFVSVYISYLILCFIPVFLSGVWLFSGPYLQWSSLKIFAVSSIIPLSFNLVWKIVIENLFSEVKWTDMFLLPFISFLLTFVVLEIVSEKFLSVDLFKGGITANSIDRSYWYIVRKTNPDGVNIANSFGFIGPEPDVNYSGIRVLIIGDSIPAAGRPINFPKVTQTIYEEKGFGGQIEIVNASISGYSLEQIKRYYAEKLKGLKHNILIICFYVDDINRELRYRKNNYLYTPNWPEWMQDVYYNCFFCRLLLNTSGFTVGKFLDYRTRSYKDAFPEALKTLDEIREIAKKRGARVAALNIPRFNWADVLTETSQYDYLEMNKKLEKWCIEQGVSYHDILPALIGSNIRELRDSDTDIHFNDLGHQMVGIELKYFLDTLIVSDSAKLLLAP